MSSAMYPLCMANPSAILLCHRGTCDGSAVLSRATRGHTYLIVLILVRDLECVHGSDHGLHGCEDILVDQLGKAPFVFIGVARPMDDPHLFDESTLAALSRP